VVDLIHALADANRSGQVVHHVNTLERALHRPRLAHIADDQFDRGMQVGRASGAGSMDLRRERVQRADLVAAVNQIVSEVGSDEPGATGNQNVHVKSPLVRPVVPGLLESAGAATSR
jgi:hypothetical protein